jgi:RecB family exonuclease
MVLPALHRLGWSGEDGDVLLARAPAVGGGSAGGADPMMRVSIQRPSAERAARLRARAEIADPPLVAAPQPAAPLLPGTPPPPGAGHLSYSALAGYAGCGYRFYVERILGLGSPAEAVGDGGEVESPPEVGADELSDPQLGPRERSLAIGNAVHAILETGARRSWQPVPAEEVERVLAREGLAGDGEARERAATLVAGWLESDLRAELADGDARLRPEVPFVLDLGGAIVRGKIDLLADTPAGPLVVDYKTDALGGADPAELASRYVTQRDLYAVAVHRAGGGGPAPVRAAYCFLEAPARTVLESYDEAGIRAAHDRLEGLIQRIREGDFKRTDSPHRSLCHGCPAAARLCGAPAWKPQWATA